MCSQDRKNFRFRCRVIFVAFLLISPATSRAPNQDSASSLPELVQCVAIASALIKDPNGFLKHPQNVTFFVLGCIQSIPNILVMIKHETGPILGAGLLVLSGYLLYESNRLQERAKDLEEDLEKYKDDFKLLEYEYSIIKDYIKKDIEPHWKNGNTAKMVRNLETVIEKLTSFFNRLNELADHADQDIKQISDDKTRSFGYVVGGTIVGFISLIVCNGNPEVFIPVSILGVFIQFYNCASIGTLDQTRKKIQLLKEAIKKKQEGIDKARANLEDVKMRADINM